MNYTNRLFSIILVVLFFFSLGNLAYCQETAVSAGEAAGIAEGPGDRVASEIGEGDELGVATLSRDAYTLGPGDILSIDIQGRSAFGYRVKPDVGPNDNPAQVAVTSTGDIQLNLVGNLQANGKTLPQLESAVHEALARYLRNFEVRISLVHPRRLSIWIGGEVKSAGPKTLSAIATASQALLRAGVKPTGSVRRAELIRGETKQIIDLYRMVVIGDIETDIQLELGDTIYVPPVTNYVYITGQVVRDGRYEMVTLSGGTEKFCIRDLLQLALGMLPTAALDKALVERIGPDGKKVAINVNLSGSNSSDMDLPLQSGDSLVIPSITAFQPMIRLIGEFKGQGVYQRVTGSEEEEVQNKSGIYYLKQGQTVMDVITRTGGVTPQADLKHARIEREENGSMRPIPIDLERMLIKGDKAADVVLLNGDSLVLPALANKVHVFGEVQLAGSYAYSPNRRLIDYLGDAGGPTDMGKLTEISIVRGTREKPEIFRVNAKNAIRGSSKKDNPILEPGDIVYVPQKFISGWRDAIQIIFTSISFASLLNRGN